MLLFADRDFRRIFTADAASKFGTQVSALALPLLAQSVLHSDAGQVGLLAMLGTVSFLVVGLPAGAWVDRVRKRPIMIAADLVRAALLASIPLAWMCGVLTLVQLYAVVLLMGIATVFFDVAHLSYVPHVVGRERLLAANSTLVSLNSVADASGRGIGGLLVHALGAPLAVVVDAASYLWSAVFTRRVTKPETPARDASGPMLRDVGEGLRFVLHHPVLRPIAVEGALTNLAIQMAVVSLLVILGGRPETVGFFLAAGGLGTLAGSLSAPLVGRALGQARAMWLPSVLLAPFALAIGIGNLWIAGAAWTLTLAKVGLDNVLRVSFRQGATPAELLGRMNATFRFLLTGALAAGAALAGLIAELSTPRAALWTAAAVLALRWTALTSLKTRPPAQRPSARLLPGPPEREKP
ncbi:MFS transporter [Streptosporangium sp. NPDC051022]|uniref:MFS transporter n=1 Tax=Streptosporangium sp. NPDC051022 TaxID=3155752 RepID=UPI003449C4CA